MGVLGFLLAVSLGTPAQAAAFGELDKLGPPDRQEYRHDCRCVRLSWAGGSAYGDVPVDHVRGIEHVHHDNGLEAVEMDTTLGRIVVAERADRTLRGIAATLSLNTGRPVRDVDARGEPLIDGCVDHVLTGGVAAFHAPRNVIEEVPVPVAEFAVTRERRLDRAALDAWMFSAAGPAARCSETPADLELAIHIRRGAVRALEVTGDEPMAACVADAVSAAQPPEPLPRAGRIDYAVTLPGAAE